MTGVFVDNAFRCAEKQRSLAPWLQPCYLLSLQGPTAKGLLGSGEGFETLSHFCHAPHGLPGSLRRSRGHSERDGAALRLFKPVLVIVSSCSFGPLLSLQDANSVVVVGQGICWVTGVIPDVSIAAGFQA